MAQNYQYYITQLKQGRAGLLHNIRLLESALTTYEQQVNAAKSAGFLENYTNPLKEQLANTKIKQEKMIESLRHMIQAIDKAIEDLEYLQGG